MRILNDVIINQNPWAGYVNKSKKFEVNEMNNRKMMFSVLLLSLILGSLSVFGATSTLVGRTQLYFHDVSVTMVNYDPDPAEAGRYVTIRFKVENSGGETAEDITLELLSQYPFSLDKGENAVKDIGSVRSRQMGDTGVIVDYKLKIDENALEGNNEIEIRYKISNGGWITPEPFEININPHDILLSVASVDAPEMIKPGDVSKIDVNLDNLALTFIKEVKVKLNLDDVPFAPIGSTDKKIIKQMEADSKATASFNLMAEPDAESNLYKVPIEIEFFDRLGTLHTKEEVVGLIIGAKPDLSIVMDDSELYVGGGIGDVAIKFVNKGVTDIKFLNVLLKESRDYNILSQKEVYVGNIDSDDYESAEFKLAMGKIKGSEVMLPLLIEYKDSNNNEYKKDIKMPLKLYSTSEAKALGLKEGSKGVGMFIMLIIVIGGFFIYKRRKKKKDGKKEEGVTGFQMPFFKKK